MYLEMCVRTYLDKYLHMYQNCILFHAPAGVPVLKDVPSHVMYLRNIPGHVLRHVPGMHLDMYLSMPLQT